MDEVSDNASEFNFTKVPYKESIIKELKKAVIFGLAAYLITAFGSGKYLLSVSVGILVFVIFFYKARKWYRFNIEKLKVNDMIYIEYTEKGSLRNVRSPIDKVMVFKKMAISKGRVPYLKIKLIETGDTITQYEIGEWDEPKMDYFKNILMRSNN